MNTEFRKPLPGSRLDYFDARAAVDAISPGAYATLPYTSRVLAENLVRRCDPATLNASLSQLIERKRDLDFPWFPARVVCHDILGQTALVDLAGLRDAIALQGGDPAQVNPVVPTQLIVDHSLAVEAGGFDPDAFEKNRAIEDRRNEDRFHFIEWTKKAFKNVDVIPPGNGIMHQINLEKMSPVVQVRDGVAFPDTCVGTDSHTPHVDALGVIAIGVGGLEAESVMLGRASWMRLPESVGVELTGQLLPGITATDMVLALTEFLRQQKVVGAWLEFFGEGASKLTLGDRATISNMAPEYGATCGFFPVDEVTLDYLRLSGRPAATVKLVEAYTKAQGLWRHAGQEPVFTDSLALDMGSVEASLAGPKRPQDRVSLPNVGQAFSDFLDLQFKPTTKEEGRLESEGGGGVAVGNADLVGETDYEYEGQTYRLKNGAVVIAAITSCTNTSNPSVMMAAGLVAKKAVEKGLTRKPWVKTSLAPGSKVVTDYYKAAGLTQYLDKIGFDLVGYGCTTCIGNSGPLPEPIEKAIQKADLAVASVLSGNRNFEGRVHPLVKTNWLASPPLVVAYALAGTVRIDISSEPLGNDQQGNPVYLKDIWPSSQEIADAVAQVSTGMFHKEYAEVFAGDEQWLAIARHRQ
ncbi:MAG TPA: aconitate hydratase, partial [Pseudomonas sp.]|nr:aconitate hydratase [Pseudomonas sp.]